MQLIHEPPSATEVGSAKEPSSAGTAYSGVETPPYSPFRSHFPIRDVFSPETPTSARGQVNAALTECAPLMGRETATKPGGATILGIHNIAIVAPQFVVRLLGSIDSGVSISTGAQTSLVAARTWPQSGIGFSTKAAANAPAQSSSA
jgi:hypothetical protein